MQTDSFPLHATDLPREDRGLEAFAITGAITAAREHPDSGFEVRGDVPTNWTEVALLVFVKLGAPLPRWAGRRVLYQALEPGDAHALLPALPPFFANKVGDVVGWQEWLGHSDLLRLGYAPTAPARIGLLLVCDATKERSALVTLELPADDVGAWTFVDGEEVTAVHEPPAPALSAEADQAPTAAELASPGEPIVDRQQLLLDRMLQLLEGNTAVLEGLHFLLAGIDRVSAQLDVIEKNQLTAAPKPPIEGEDHV